LAESFEPTVYRRNFRMLTGTKQIKCLLDKSVFVITEENIPSVRGALAYGLSFTPGTWEEYPNYERRRKCYKRLRKYFGQINTS
jgi:hypothetical protein